MGLFTSKEEKNYYKLKAMELCDKNGWCRTCFGQGLVAYGSVERATCPDCNGTGTQKGGDK